MRIGFVGCGAIFSHYANVIKVHIPQISITAVCDLDKSKGDSINNASGAKFYTNIHNMIAGQNLDACFILTPSGLHYEHSKICLNAGINTFVEKPIALTIEHALELNKLAKEKNVALGAVYQNRFNKSIQLAKQLIDDAVFGKRVLTSVRLFWARNNDYYKGWRGTWALDGGVMAQQAIHHLDMLQWLNSPIEKVYCMGKTLINKLEAEDTAIGTVLFQDGSLGSFQVTTAARPKDLEASITILGENGYIEIGGLALNKIKDINVPDMKMGGKDLIDEHSESVEKGYGNGHIAYLKNVYESFVSGKIVAPVSGEDAVDSLKLVQALYMSSENDLPVQFSNNIKSRRLGVR
ncbi:MAG: oxidoreductase [Nitrospiraceae bacterium]|nr:oxidoreductase [Nitrospiraceae bacterium]